MPEDKESFPPPSSTEKIYTEHELELGRKFYNKLKSTQIHTSWMGKMGLRSIRGIEPIEAWTIETGGVFPSGPIFTPAQSDTRYVSNLTYELLDPHTNVRKLGIGIEAHTADGVRRPIFFETTADGKIEVLVAKETTSGFSLEPLEVNYDALAGFIDKPIGFGSSLE